MSFIEHLELKNITLVCQDWGGILGLTLPIDMKDMFSRLLIMNTTLGTGDFQLSKGFLEWRAWVRKNPDMSAGRLLKLEMFWSLLLKSTPRDRHALISCGDSWDTFYGAREPKFD